MWLLCLALVQAFELPQLMSFEERFQFANNTRARHQGAEVVYDSKLGFSIALTKNVAKGDCVSGAYTKDALTSRDPYQLTPFVLGLKEYEQLAVRLVYERLLPRDKSNNIREYVHFLPVNLDMPLFWTDEEFELLEQHTLDSFSRQELRMYNLMEIYSRVVTALERATDLPPGMLEPDALKWGLGIAMSRSYSDGGEIMKRAYGLENETRSYQSLVPVLDLVNHAPLPAKVRATRVTVFQVYLGESNWICLRAPFKQKAGRHFLGNYGNYANWRLVKDYGFALERNLDDTIQLSLPFIDFCGGRVLDDRCHYSTPIYQLSVPALQHFLREKAEFKVSSDISIDDLFNRVSKALHSKHSKLTFAVLSYRSHVLGQLTKTPLRALFRNRENCQSYRCQLIFTYAISQRLGRLLHARQVERKLLGLLSKNIL